MQTISMQTNQRSALLFMILAVGLAITIFIESSQPPLEIIAQTPGLDKLAHFVTFGILASLIYLTLGKLHQHKWLTPFAVTIAISAIIGFSDELYQLLNPVRAFDLWDFLADLGGTVSFISLLKLFHK